MSTSLRRSAFSMFVVAAACGGTTVPLTVEKPDGGQSSGSDAHFTLVDAGHAEGSSGSHDDGATASDVSAPPFDAESDGARSASCTPTSSEKGTAVDTEYGRLDGTLVYVVDVGQDTQCNGDDSHVHLQIEVSGSVYDVAVDVGTAPNDEVGVYQETLALPGGAWSEGWHGTDALSYTTLGLDSSSFMTMSPGMVATQVEAMLAATTRISIFCKGYKQGNGCHDVHYENGTDDGAIFLSPTEAMSPVLFFRFTDQSF